VVVAPSVRIDRLGPFKVQTTVQTYWLTLREPSFTVSMHFQWWIRCAMSPLDVAWQQLIPALHASGRKAALAITGGGSAAVGELLRVPGASRLLFEAQVPYDEAALAAFLGFAPAQACSSDTAIAMARVARARAARSVPAGADAVGLGATAALVSDRPRKGEHRFHIAFANSAGTAHCTGVMAKGRRNRAAEEPACCAAARLEYRSQSPVTGGRGIERVDCDTIANCRRPRA